MAAPGKADLTGPRVAFAFRPLPEKDLEASRTVAKDDHHRGGRFRLQLRFGELEGQQELPQAFEGGFGHPDAVYAVPRYNGIHPPTDNIDICVLISTHTCPSKRSPYPRTHTSRWPHSRRMARALVTSSAGSPAEASPFWNSRGTGKTSRRKRCRPTCPSSTQAIGSRKQNSAANSGAAGSEWTGQPGVVVPDRSPEERPGRGGSRPGSRDLGRTEMRHGTGAPRRS